MLPALSGADREAALERSLAWRVGPGVARGRAASPVALLRDPFNDGGEALAGALERLADWGPERVPKEFSLCGFSDGFSGYDTFRQLYDTRQPGVNFQAKKADGTHEAASAEPLWPLREALWPLAKELLDRRGFGADAAALERARDEAEASGRFTRQAAVLTYLPHNPGNGYKAEGRHNNSGQRGSYHPHLDESCTIDVVNVTLGNDCQLILHTGVEPCSRVEDMGRVPHYWCNPGGAASEWRQCNGCEKLEFRSGDVLWFGAESCVHGIGDVADGRSGTSAWAVPAWLKDKRAVVGLRLQGGSRAEETMRGVNLPRFFGSPQMKAALSRALGRPLVAPQGLRYDTKIPLERYQCAVQDAEAWLLLEGEETQAVEGCAALIQRLKQMAEGAGAPRCECGLPAVVQYAAAADKPQYRLASTPLRYGCGRYLLLGAPDEGRPCGFDLPCPSDQQTLAAAYERAAEARAKDIASLAAMGFGTEEAGRALDRAKGGVEAALSILLSGGGAAGGGGEAA
mmetsp:Transcript_16732/g.54695  ORF Transcript_16732/g.54695 Transcript_16732/m.54695 type:complete len:514 (+) Transcript_16732:36-1577(+)